MKTNQDLQRNVQDVIKWKPLQSNQIDVSAQDDIVTLEGTLLDNYTKKMEAEQTIKDISPLKALVDDLKIDLSRPAIRNDIDISSSVIKVLTENWAVPHHKIKVSVENGLVTLEGILHWNFQRKAADNAIRYLEGVRGVSDKIKIEAEIKNELRQETLKKVLSDSWILEIDNIKIRVDGKKIFLSGIVSSLFQKEEAEKIAWNTPGVWYVDNELLVEFD